MEKKTPNEKTRKKSHKKKIFENACSATKHSIVELVFLMYALGMCANGIENISYTKETRANRRVE